jgi:hypothetical protein
MYAVVRSYAGPGAPQLFDELDRRKADVEKLIRGVPGFVSYTLFRTSQGGVSVTVCQDKAGTDESIRIAAVWVRENAPTAANPPTISEGQTILQLN